MEDKLQVILRDAIQEDLPLVYNSWLKQYRNSPFTTGMGNDLYFTQHRKVISAILKRSEVRVACDPNDSNTVYGWACGESYDTPLIHFLYVKKDFRGSGLGKMLLSEYGWESGKHIISTHYLKYRGKEFSVGDKQIIYNPYLINIYLAKEKENEN